MLVGSLVIILYGDDRDVSFTLSPMGARPLPWKISLPQKQHFFSLRGAFFGLVPTKISTGAHPPPPPPGTLHQCCRSDIFLAQMLDKYTLSQQCLDLSHNLQTKAVLCNTVHKTSSWTWIAKPSNNINYM